MFYITFLIVYIICMGVYLKICLCIMSVLYAFRDQKVLDTLGLQLQMVVSTK